MKYTFEEICKMPPEEAYKLILEMTREERDEILKQAPEQYHKGIKHETNTIRSETNSSKN